ncbi:protein-methionine-sulfoxide reductase heme-binding subunit MsrQ [Anaerolineales bacterium HSG6]|nr:protein-methionine-sulfoxide reductase heme-binding subunit MsrQ [Anaerolineales bacterium HSG6]
MNWFKKNWLWVTVHTLALLPLSFLIIDTASGNLSVNPIQKMTHITGETAIRLLVLSLACTPLNIIFGWRQVIPLRKPLGMYTFMYAALHFLIFIGLDYGFDAGLVWEATFEKQFALVGFLALALMIPLALTSNRWSMRRLGKNWKRLHQLVYLISILAVLHFLLSRKLTLDPEVLIYGGVILMLLAIRVPPIRKKITAYRRTRYEPYHKGD